MLVGVVGWPWAHGLASAGVVSTNHHSTPNASASPTPELSFSYPTPRKMDFLLSLSLLYATLCRYAFTLLRFFIYCFFLENGNFLIHFLVAFSTGCVGSWQ